MKSKRLCLTLVVIFMCSILTGCWDKVELEDEGYVAAIGIDKGAGRNVRVTFQITNPKTIGSGRSGGGSGEIKSEVMTLEAPSVLSARDLITISVTRRISLAHAKVVVVGEDFARDESFFRYIEASLRDKEMRRIMTIIVSREPAEEFIKKNNPLLEDRMQKFYEFTSRRWKETGFVPPFANLNRFMQRTETHGSLFLAIYATTREFPTKKGADEGAYMPGQIEKSGGSPAEMIGAAVFKDGKMIGKLDGNEMRLVSMLRQEPETRAMLVTFLDPLDNKYRIDARIIRENRTKIKLNLEGEVPVIDTYVPLTMDILGIPSFVDYAEDMEKQKYLKDYLEKYLSKISLKLVDKTQKEFAGDPFQWDLAARRKFFTYDEFHKYDWMKHYPEAKVNIKFEINIRSFGKQLAPPSNPMEKGNDEGISPLERKE